MAYLTVFCRGINLILALAGLLEAGDCGGDNCNPILQCLSASGLSWELLQSDQAVEEGETLLVLLCRFCPRHHFVCASQMVGMNIL